MRKTMVNMRSKILITKENIFPALFNNVFRKSSLISHKNYHQGFKKHRLILHKIFPL